MSVRSIAPVTILCLGRGYLSELRGDGGFEDDFGKGAIERWTIGSSDGELTDAGNSFAIVHHSGYGHTAGRQRPSSTVWSRWRVPKPCYSVSTSPTQEMISPESNLPVL